MNSFKFPVINPLLHNELRLKVMVILDCLECADFMYILKNTESTKGNLSIQLTTLKKAGYVDIAKTGLGCFSHTVCRITDRGREALRTYEKGLRAYFSQDVSVQAKQSEAAG